MDKINIGIIGCGRISDLHIPGYKNHPQARIFAVCDSDREIAERLKLECGAEKVYTDYRELIADPAVEAVEILTPHLLHEAMVVEAAGAGKHIAVQKPMTVSLESADRMIAATARAGTVFRVTDNYVFYPPIVRAKRMIEDGIIGKPSNLRIKLIAGGKGGWDIPSTAWKWRLTENAAGRGLQTFDHGHHLWAAAWYLLGKVERVSAWIDSLDGIIDSPAAIMWKFEGGPCYGMCEYAYSPDLNIPSKYYANDEWIEITGSKGIILIQRCTGAVQSGPVLRLFNGGQWIDYADIKDDWAEGFIGATENFIRAIRGEEQPLLSGAQGREILKMNLAISKSARVRREVYVDELDAPYPSLYTRRHIWREKKTAADGKGILSVLGFGKKEEGLADQARGLTEDLVLRFNPEAAQGWNVVVGLHITPQGKAPEMLYHLKISGGQAEMVAGRWPDDADLVIQVPAGTWAAVLLGKKRIETALLQGKLKLKGKAEHGLKLRSAFGI